MKTIVQGITALLVAASTVSYALDHNPISAGTTQSRNVIGTACEGPFHNPALLGVERDKGPHGGLLLVPFTDYGVGVWSNKLTLSPFNDYFSAVKDSTKREFSALLTKILRTSFDLPAGPTYAGDSAAYQRADSIYAEDISRRLTDGFRGGFTAFIGYRMSLMNFANGHFGFDISTHVEEDFTMPEGPLFAAFSGTEGLLRGRTLDFSNFRQNGIWTTDFTFDLGLPVNIPALHDLFGLRKGAGGVAIKYVMGHSLFQSTMSNGRLTYDSLTNSLTMNGELTLQTAGTGFSGPLRMAKNGPFTDGFPINGHGFGTDIGGILYDDHGTLSLGFNNIGVIFWIKDVNEAKYNVNKAGLDAMDIIDGIVEDDSGNTLGDQSIYKIFGKRGDEFPTSGDSLRPTNSITTIMPMTFNLGYAQVWDYSQKGSYVDYCNWGINYEQALVRSPGRTLIPRFTLGGEAGTLYGYFPIRLGFIFGGSEIMGSGVGAGFNFRYFSINAAYKALGTLWFNPKRGMELAAGLGFNWGYGRPNKDTDGDGILDIRDKCPLVPEDKDGFQDADGCPEYDNDKDSIPDTVDRCANIPEDKDGFEDADGCPDYDNDRDGIIDSLDKCPMAPEDYDGFQDADGCMEPDNDADGIPDTLDRCSLIPEDIDGYEDQDGCPDYDNDRDGIPDSLDKCINEPEVYNGYKDEDGCADTILKPTVREMQILNTKLRDINFKTASAELLPASFAALEYVTTFLRQYPLLKYEVQGHCDSRGNDDYNMVLSAARVASVKNYLIGKGIPEETLIAIGYGESRPVATNKTAAGRALNRRVEFKFIETPADYSALKVQEEMFRDRIRTAKIRGAQY